MVNTNKRTGIRFGTCYGSHVNENFWHDQSYHSTQHKYNEDLYIIKTKEYKAIYDANDNSITVLWSRFKTFGSACSPCFPNGCYFAKPGDIEGYCLPPDYMVEPIKTHRRRRFYND